MRDSMACVGYRFSCPQNPDQSPKLSDRKILERKYEWEREHSHLPNNSIRFLDRSCLCESQLEVIVE